MKSKHIIRFPAASAMMLLFYIFSSSFIITDKHHIYHLTSRKPSFYTSINTCFSNNEKIISEMSDWAAIPLSNMIGTARLIAWGSIQQVRDSTYLFKVNKRIKGKFTGESLEVLKFYPSKFESEKIQSYKNDQQYILFLNHPKDLPGSHLWKIMGIGGEGQMPVQDGYVYFHANNIEGLPFDHYNVYGAVQFIQRFDFNLFLNAMQEYGNCFHWNYESVVSSYVPHQLCDETTANIFAQKSFIHNYLKSETQLKIPKD